MIYKGHIVSNGATRRLWDEFHGANIERYLHNESFVYIRRKPWVGGRGVIKEEKAQKYWYLKSSFRVFMRKQII